MKDEEKFTALFERVINGLLIKKGYATLQIKIKLESRDNLKITQRVNPIKKRIRLSFPSETFEKGSIEPFLENSIYGFLCCVGKESPMGENTYIRVEVLPK
jgi:hypothetical protein